MVTLQKKDWQEQLKKIDDSIVVIDEDCKFINSLDFARMIKNTINYYLLITRVDAAYLPYSINEIYELSGKKNKTNVPLYSVKENIHPKIKKFIPSVIIVEDSNSGFQFFNDVKKQDIKCISSSGKSNILNELKKIENIETEKILIIADGAAFGSEISNLYQYSKNKNIVFYLPESFEWLILKSGVIGKKVKELKETENYIESSMFFSWENFFEYLLCELTSGYKNKSYKKYSKIKLDKFYLIETNVKKILKQIEKISIR